MSLNSLNFLRDPEILTGGRRCGGLELDTHTYTSMPIHRLINKIPIQNENLRIFVGASIFMGILCIPKAFGKRTSNLLFVHTKTRRITSIAR
jgi:hypothetical protein